jgi:hypothetical protein
MDKILIVEDEKTIRASVAEILSLFDYDVIVAENGKDGYAKSVTEHPDLIICDVMMPEMDGYQLLEELKKDESFETPFIFLTAKVQSDEIRKGMNIGADDYIFKPFKSKDLLNAVRVRLESRKKKERNLIRKTKDLETLVKFMIGHEFKTPMNGIMSMTNLINQNLGDIDEEEFAKFCDYLNVSSNRLLSTFEKVRKFYELQDMESSIILKKDQCNPADMIINIAQTIAEKFNRMDDLEFCSIDDAVLNIKSNLLFSAVYEVIENAFKFSGKQQKVKISAKLNTSLYQITVADNGEKIKAAEISNYQSFQQFNRDKYEQQGLGAGLALAKSIMEQNHGNIIFMDNQPTGIIAIINFKI